MADGSWRIVQKRTIQLLRQSPTARVKIQNPKSKIPLLLLLLVFLAAGSLRAQPVDPSPGVQIITAEEIEQAGRVLRVRSIVEGERDLVPALGNRTQHHPLQVALDGVDVQQRGAHEPSFLDAPRPGLAK